MTDYDWTTIRTQAIRKLADTPGAQLEHDLIEAFKDNPRQVAQTINAVIAERDAGTIFAKPWAVIRYRVNQNPEPVVATDTTERERHIRQAEAWIRTTGLHINDPSELLHELFGDQAATPTLEQLRHLEQTTRGNPGRPMYQPLLTAAITKTELEGPQPLPDSDPGRLHAYDTPDLRKRLLTLWREHRPRGQKAEHDHEQRALDRVALRSRLNAAQTAHMRQPHIEPESDPDWHNQPEPATLETE